MHAILVTFTPEATEEEIMAELGPRMKATITTDGLIMKTFVESGPERWGGFYLFSDEARAKAYLAGEFFQWFSTSSLLSNVEIQHFAVEDEPSKAFGTPSQPLAERRAA